MQVCASVTRGHPGGCCPIWTNGVTRALMDENSSQCLVCGLQSPAAAEPELAAPEAAGFAQSAFALFMSLSLTDGGAETLETGISEPHAPHKVASATTAMKTLRDTIQLPFSAVEYWTP